MTYQLHRQIEAAILERLTPVSPLPSNTILTAQLFTLFATVVALGSCQLGCAGLRALPDIQASLLILLSGAAGLFLSAAASRQMIPGSRQAISPWMTLLFPIVGVCSTVICVFPSAWDPAFVALGLRCWMRGLIWAAASGSLFVLVLSQGALLAPGWQGATAGLLAGFAGFTVLEISCPYQDRAHIVICHGGAALTFMLAAAGATAFVGRRVPFATIRDDSRRNSTHSGCE